MLILRKRVQQNLGNCTSAVLKVGHKFHISGETAHAHNRIHTFLIRTWSMEIFWETGTSVLLHIWKALTRGLSKTIVVIHISNFLWKLWTRNRKLIAGEVLTNEKLIKCCCWQFLHVRVQNKPLDHQNVCLKSAANKTPPKLQQAHRYPLVCDRKDWKPERYKKIKLPWAKRYSHKFYISRPFMSNLLAKLLGRFHGQLGCGAIQVPDKNCLCSDQRVFSKPFS